MLSHTTFDLDFSHFYLDLLIWPLRPSKKITRSANHQIASQKVNLVESRPPTWDNKLPDQQITRLPEVARLPDKTIRLPDLQIAKLPEEISDPLTWPLGSE